MSKLVSVIIPVYKPNLDFLNQCIESVINQTYKNLEIIIVFDKSSNTEIDTKALELIRNYNDTRIILIVQERGGVAHARNIAISKSKGEYLALMDADDVCDIHRIEKQVEFFNKHDDADIVGSYLKIIDEKNKVIGTMKLPLDPKSIRNTIMISIPFINPTTMFKKTIVENGNLYNESFRIASDYEFFIRQIANGSKGFNIDEPLLLYRENKKSISRTAGLRFGYYYTNAKLIGIALGLRTPRDLMYFVITLPAFFFNRKIILFAYKTIGRLFQRSIKD